MQHKSWSFSSRKPPLRPRKDSSSSAPGDSCSRNAEQLKKSEQGGSRDNNFRYGAAAVQGFRPVMQDNFSCFPSRRLNGKPLGCFAVFDGHGNHGDIVSQYCADHFIESLLERKALRGSRSVSSETIAVSLRKTFLKFDFQLKEVVQKQNPNEKKVSFVFSGTTATVALVTQRSLVIANTGDSRTLLCRSGSLQFATADHNPGDQVETDRIVAAGGKIHTTPSKHKVILDTEAYTNLAVSRTLGDFGFKCTPKIPAEDQIVTPVPDITVLERDHKTDEFLLLASDGIFKSMSNSDVVDFVSRQLTLTDDHTKICHNLIEMAYYSPICVPDDTTVILVVFPAAPTVSPKAINEEQLIEAEGLKAIEGEIEKLVREAEGKWVLDNDFNIIQKLVKTMPQKYCVQLRNEFIKESLSNAKLDQFGVKDSEEMKEASHSETDGPGKHDPDVYTPEIAASHRVHLRSDHQHDFSDAGSDVITGDVISGEDISPVVREGRQDSGLENCSADIGNLGIPVDTTSAEIHSEANQLSSTGEIIL